MRFGSVAHKVLLEPEDFDSEFAIQPDNWNDNGTNKPIDRRIKGCREWLNDWQEAQGNKIVCSKEEYELAHQMRDVLERENIIQHLIDEGKAELSGFWKDTETGLQLKYRPDYRTESYLLDYKTCQSVREDKFKFDLQKYGYFQSAAHYLDGDNAITGSTHDTFILLAQSKQAPFEYRLYTISDRDIELGRAMNRAAKLGIAECINHNYWPYLGRKVQEINLHDGAFNVLYNQYEQFLNK